LPNGLTGRIPRYGPKPRKIKALYQIAATGGESSALIRGGRTAVGGAINPLSNLSPEPKALGFHSEARVAARKPSREIEIRATWKWHVGPWAALSRGMTRCP